MFNRKSIYIFLLSATICSLVWSNQVFLVMLGISLLIVLFLNRGIFYTFRANKLLVTGRVDRGYKLLKKAYKTNTVPYLVINGFIYLSLKRGNFEVAKEAIEKVLIGDVSCKIKDTHRSQAITLKSLYLWKTGNLKEGLELLDNLYEKNYVNTIFYGNYGYMLYLDGQLEKAEEVTLKAYEYGNDDKVTIDNIISIYIETKRWEEALQYYIKLIELKPKFPEAYFHGAKIFLNNNEIEKAQEAVDKALGLEFSYMSSITKDEVIALKSKIEEN